eukprot:4564280-Alexandrium_andersonii.AAC.1
MQGIALHLEVEFGEELRRGIAAGRLAGELGPAVQASLAGRLEYRARTRGVGWPPSVRRRATRISRCWTCRSCRSPPGRSCGLCWGPVR